MTSAHFFSDRVDGDVVRITGDEARHAARVLRIAAGETITVSDGRGNVVDARVSSATASQVAAAVLHRRSVDRGRPSLVVCPALPKSGKLDLIVQKLTELGVDRIHPWPAARSVVKWDAAKASANGERLRAIAHEAAKQSRRAWLPSVADPGPLPELSMLTVVLHEGAAERLRELLPEAPPDEIAVIVGPEGGLTDDEIELFEAGGARIAGLGPQILRAETAAVVGPAIVLSCYGLVG